MEMDDLLTSEEIATPTIKDTVEKRKTRKHVSFPSNDNELVTGYLEPANPWENAHDVKTNDVILFYKESCQHHKTVPLANVIAQLEKMQVAPGRIKELCLKKENLDRDHCEPLEEIFKRLQFHKIDLEAASLDDESAEILFNMFEYYESAKHVNISNNCNIGARGWQSCAQMLKKTLCLEQLDAKDIVLTQQHLNILKRPLQLVSHLQILKLENCNLAGKAFGMLISALKLNTGLKELYLADNHLEKQDGTQLGLLLKVNHHLQLLDVSNNNLQDVGAHDILNSLIVQSNDTPSGKGLSILIMWNNHLTKELSQHFSQLIAQSKSLETLNIGKNAMGDEFLEICKESLMKSHYLLQLGLQSTGLILKSVMALAEIIEINATLQRIDLRDNSIQLTPLTFLSLALKKNTTITQIDLDDTAGSKSQQLLQQYSELLGEIRGYCVRNDELRSPDSSTEDSTSSPQQRSRLSSCSSRKISLTCQTLPRTPPTMATSASGVTANEVYGRTTTISESKRTSGGRLRSPAPSPIPSPVASPIPSPSRSRFVVSRVSEQTLINNSNNSSTSSSPITTPSSLSNSPTCFFPPSNGVTTNSRFRVTIVEPPAPISASPSSSSSSPPSSLSSIPGSLPVNNFVTAPFANTNRSIGFNCTIENSMEITDTINFDNCKSNSINTSISDEKEKVEQVKSVPMCSEIIKKKEGEEEEDEEQQQRASSSTSSHHMSSLEKLLGLFQHPGNLFTSAFVDKKENKNPLHSSMSSIIELGDKFQQYLRDGRGGMNDNKQQQQCQHHYHYHNEHVYDHPHHHNNQRLTSSVSQSCDSISMVDDKCELINNKSLIGIDNDKVIDTISDINLPVNSFTNNSYVPELFEDDCTSSSIDKSSENIVDNDKTFHNTLNNRIDEICDNSTNCSINLSNSNDNNYSHCNIISDINNVNIVNNVIEKNVDNVNSEILNCHQESNDDSVNVENLLDINCDKQEQQPSSVKLILPENHFAIDHENNENVEKKNDKLNCEMIDDINNILSSILDMIPFETSNDNIQGDKQLPYYIESEKIVNFDEVKSMVHNNNVTIIGDNIGNHNNAHCQLYLDEIVDQDGNDDEIVEKQLDENILKPDPSQLSNEIINDKQTDTIVDENNCSYPWMNTKSTTLTISSDNSYSNSSNPSDNIHSTTIATMTTPKSDVKTTDICQLNGTHVTNSVINDNYNGKLLENNYSDNSDVFTDEIIYNIADITLHDGPMSLDASIMFEHNSETSSNIDTLSENPSSSRDSYHGSIDSGIDDILLKDKRNIQSQIAINIPILNDDEYLTKDTTIENLIIAQNIDEKELSTNIIQFTEDNTNSSNDIINKTGLK